MKWILLVALIISLSVNAQDFSKTKIETIKLTDSLHMLIGAGGNIAVLSGPDGVFMVDDQFAPLSEKIEAAVKKISPEPLKYVFNTHWHYDHTGGNENFGKKGAAIVAHENVRKLLSKDQVLKVFNRMVKATPKDGLPVITFDSEMNFHLNEEHVNVFHVANAHTSGDSIIHFKKANVFHMGDTFFKDTFPFIDTQHGGSLQGVINAAKMVLAKSNAKSRIIPGHGTLATPKDLKRYLDNLIKIDTRLKKLAKQKKSLADVKEMNPLKDLDKDWGQGFIKTQKLYDIVYPTLL